VFNKIFKLQKLKLNKQKQSKILNCYSHKFYNLKDKKLKVLLHDIVSVKLPEFSVYLKVWRYSYLLYIGIIFICILVI
jgi:hypothetical protein